MSTVTDPLELAVRQDPRDDEATGTGSAALWAMIGAIPALVSILRLWVEAGGDLQTTLLLVEGVGPVSFIAAFVTTTSWLLSAVLVFALACGTVISRSADTHPAARRRPRSPFARIAREAPQWFKITVFAVAFLTWDLIFLPLLGMAICVVFRLPLFRPDSQKIHKVVTVGVLATYFGLTGPTTVSAAEQIDLLPLLLLLAPPLLLALGAGGTFTGRHLQIFSAASHILTVCLGAAVIIPILQTPVMPLTVVAVKGDDAPRGLEAFRGYVVETSEVSVTMLEENGGVLFIPSHSVVDRVLCPDVHQSTRYDLWIRDFHIEESILQGWGRHVRPVSAVQPRCRESLLG